MDRRQKSTLRAHHIHLANELILDEDFFAALRQNKIFTDGMLQIIKDVRKPRDQVYKMLELLEKRGPAAYENFVWILRENFSWIADKLEETYEMKGHRERSSHHLLRRAVSTPQETTTRTQAPISVPIPTSAGSFKNPVGKRVYFKSDPAPETSNHNRGDEDNDNNNDDNVDEQDGGAIKQSSSTKHASEIKTMVKQFADKCISPIQIIESPRKPLSSFTQVQEDTGSDPVEFVFKQESCEETDSAVFSDNTKNPDVEIADDEEASVFDDNNSDMSDFNELDGGDNIELEDGEIFYDRMRRESEVNESFGMCADDVDGGLTQAEESVDEMESQINSSIEFGQMEEDSEIQDMYVKLLDATNTLLKPDMDLGQIGITYKMIHELIDKLVEDKQAGEDNTKMVKKCLGLFPEKDRKFPLNKNIENLQEEKTDINNRLFEEIRKTNEMAHDMYLHSQEMKNIERMKARMNDLEKENSLLQMKKLNLEKDAQAKDNRISDLEKNMKLFDEIRQNSTEKKPLPARRNSQRRIVPGMQSPRKPSLGPGSQMGNLRSPYTGGQASPRPGASSAWTRHYPKR